MADATWILYFRKNSHSMVKKELVLTAVKYGVVGGILIISPFLMLHFMDLKPLINLNTLILEGMLMFIFIYLGTREFRDNHNQGILKFWQGMTSGFLIYLIMTLIFLIFLWMFIYYMVPDYLESYKLGAAEYLDDSLEKITDEAEKEILLQQKENIDNTSRGDLLLDGIFRKLILGLIITPISTVFLRRY